MSLKLWLETKLTASVAAWPSHTEITHNILLKVIPVSFVFELVSDDRLASTAGARILQAMSGGHWWQLESEMHMQSAHRRAHTHTHRGPYAQ